MFKYHLYLPQFFSVEIVPEFQGKFKTVLRIYFRNCPTFFKYIKNRITKSLNNKILLNETNNFIRLSQISQRKITTHPPS